jgi:carotenoid cleavage dioxygenase-like enzyme
LTFGVADSAGKLLHEASIDLPGPRLPHDMGFTTHYAVLHDLPFFHDMNV